MNNTVSPVVTDEAYMDAQLHKKHTNPVLVFGILTVLTIIEILIALLQLPKSTIVPVLLTISFVKAGLVAAYYMHLRYERWIYTAIFAVPATFAFFLLLVLMS
jgi:cytochrome c oxidase subunit 4